MKGSDFRTFFTVVLLCVLFSSFINAQNNKSSVNKSAISNKSQPTVKPSTTNKSIISTANPTVSEYPASATETAILQEINAVRNNPQKYITYLEDYRKLFQGKLVSVPGQQAFVTIEGVSAVDEGINFLKTLNKLNPYSMSKGLTQSANLQLKDLINDSSLAHTGKNGSTLSQRLDKFGSVGSVFAENITYYAKTPREIVMEMIIDDGVKSRSHRKNLFSPTFKQIGLGFGDGKHGETLCIIVFADSFKEGGMSAMRQL